MREGKGGSALHPHFAERMRGQLGAEADTFFAVLESESPVSLFINPFKDPGEYFKEAEPIPWCPYGRYLKRRPEFTFDPLFHAGCYYVMEASSMFLFHVLSSIVRSDKPICALDLCGAPGGKSVITLSNLPQGSLLVSNEVIKSRFQILQYNIDKWGAPNVIRTSLDSTQIPWTGMFDLIVVDAPCSGEGLFRKDKEARAEWDPANVMHCSARQKRILTEAERLLAPGGVLIYSTCTYNDDENIHQVRWMAEQFGMASKQIPVTDEWNIREVQSGNVFGYQFYPHKVRGEGFFCAVVEKATGSKPVVPQSMKAARSHKSLIKEATLPIQMKHLIKPDAIKGSCRFFESIDNEFYVLQSAIEPDLIDSGLVRYPGTEIYRTLLSFRGTAGSRETPSHALALSTILHPETPSVELTKDQAIAYLRKDPLQIKCEAPGWNVARYNGFALGWLKQTQAGLKNYLPTKYRIIKQQVK